MNPKSLNFGSTVEASTRMTPHLLYENLAIDAVLLEMNDQLPQLGEEENSRLVNAAATAARTVLELAKVPSDWISVVEALHKEPMAKVRDQLHDYIFELIGNTPSEITEDQLAAIEAIRAVIPREDYGVLNKLMGDLEQAYGIEINYVIEQAFTLGFQIAKDPTPLIFEAKSHG